MDATVGSVIDVLETAYPPALAEEWDTGIGLTCGDRSAAVSGVLFAVDVDDAVVAQAEELGAELLVTHHPLLFAPVQSVAADGVQGGLVHRLIRAGIAHFAAHTNADKAVGGVNDALAAVLGLTDLRPLVPDPAGALPDGHSQSGRTGTGRIGRLPGRTTLEAFVELAAGVLPATVGGVRAAGRADRTIEVVAVCGGAGGSELPAATAAGAQVYLTSDLRHHLVAEHVADPASPAVVDVAHWAGEWCWLPRAAEVVTAAAAAGLLPGSLRTTVSTLRTDPWTIRRPSSTMTSRPHASEGL